jgi:co-chaperonin GroES (HSP10)|tara:strand:- start:78 stop:350 length:273 start_codon:yes stop_codon:yes gene_type:complete
MKAFGKYIAIERNTANQKMAGGTLELSSKESSDISIQSGKVLSCGAGPAEYINEGDVVYYNKAREVSFKNEESETVTMISLDSIVAISKP